MNPFRYFGRAPWWGISLSHELYPHRTAQHRQMHISIARAVFEPMIPVLELDRAATLFFVKHSLHQKFLKQR